MFKNSFSWLVTTSLLSGSLLSCGSWASSSDMSADPPSQSSRRSSSKASENVASARPELNRETLVRDLLAGQDFSNSTLQVQIERRGQQITLNDNNDNNDNKLDSSIQGFRCFKGTEDNSGYLVYLDTANLSDLSSGSIPFWLGKQKDSKQTRWYTPEGGHTDSEVENLLTVAPFKAFAELDVQPFGEAHSSDASTVEVELNNFVAQIPHLDLSVILSPTGAKKRRLEFPQATDEPTYDAPNDEQHFTQVYVPRVIQYQGQECLPKGIKELAPEPHKIEHEIVTGTSCDNSHKSKQLRYRGKRFSTIGSTEEITTWDRAPKHLEDN